MDVSSIATIVSDVRRTENQRTSVEKLTASERPCFSRPGPTWSVEDGIPTETVGTSVSHFLLERYDMLVKTRAMPWAVLYHPVRVEAWQVIHACSLIASSSSSAQRDLPLS